MSDQKKFPISRRAVLRGAGVALGLPWLEAMGSSRAWAATEDGKPPVRMAILYMPNGIHPDMWTPEGEGRDFQLSPTLEPLADLKDDILVPTNLWNQNSDTGDGHYVKLGGFLTGTTINKTVGVDINANGVSMDQVAAQKLGHLTPLPSLELGTEPVRTGVDRVVGYTRVYGAHVAWRGPTNPLAKEINPQLAYERLLRAQRQSGEETERTSSLLDLVLDDAHTLQKRLGAGDRQKMDEYLQSVRSLEERLERARRTADDAWEPRADVEQLVERRPPGVPQEHAEHVRLMLDTIVLAFQADITRIATFMFGNAVSNISFAFLDGVDGAHHYLSHHQYEEDKLRQYQRINQWHIEQYAYLLRRLKQIPEGDSTLLDNTMVLFGSGLRCGHRHAPQNLPIVLGGRGGGRIATGQHLVYERNTPLTNLYLCMLDAFGTPVKKFADSTEPLPGVLA